MPLVTIEVYNEDGLSTDRKVEPLDASKYLCDDLGLSIKGNKSYIKFRGRLDDVLNLFMQHMGIEFVVEAIPVKGGLAKSNSSSGSPVRLELHPESLDKSARDRARHMVENLLETTATTTANIVLPGSSLVYSGVKRTHQAHRATKQFLADRKNVSQKGLSNMVTVVLRPASSSKGVHSRLAKLPRWSKNIAGIKSIEFGTPTKLAVISNELSTLAKILFVPEEPSDPT